MATRGPNAPTMTLGFVGVLFALLVVLPIAACEEDPSISTAEYERNDIVFDAGRGTTIVPDANVPTATRDAGPDVGVDAGPDAAPPACNDGKLDPGETCDPLGSCPTTCPALGCQLRTLNNPGTCTATCVNGAAQTVCANGDGCCPAGCNATNDDDCAPSCGNSVLEGTETCDPLGSCPTSCPSLGCQLRTLQNAGTCQAACVNGALTTACANGDGCCPTGCTVGNDSDCAPGCGDNVVTAPETCDPLASCPTACPPLGCQLRTLQNAGTCQAACVNTTTQTTCANNDGCCPTGCNANNDNDCSAACGNGAVEAGETCDPLGSCPTSCPQLGCQLRTLDKAGTCQASCTAKGFQSACVNSDGCCPTGCNANTDNDCKAVCGNLVIEPGETCDGACRCVAPVNSCYVTQGKAATCDLACDAPATCGTKGDGCCPYESGGCGARSDPECAGSTWQWVQWPTVIDTSDPKTSYCATVTVSGITAGGSYDFTTCSPPGGGGTGDGDPIIKSLLDAKGVNYDYAGNDNCSDKTALPVLAGSECRNKSGALTMACASPSPGGIVIQNGPSVTLKICAANATSAGRTPLYIWYNAPTAPNPG